VLSGLTFFENCSSPTRFVFGSSHLVQACSEQECNFNNDAVSSRQSLSTDKRAPPTTTKTNPVWRKAWKQGQYLMQFWIKASQCEVCIQSYYIYVLLMARGLNLSLS